MNTKQEPKSVWTRREEEQLTELLERKQRIMAERRIPVAAVAGDMLGTMAHPSSEAELTDALIAHAESLRDALEPFDSGTRQA